VNSGYGISGAFVEKRRAGANLREPARPEALALLRGFP